MFNLLCDHNEGLLLRQKDIDEGYLDYKCDKLNACECLGYKGGKFVYCEQSGYSKKLYIILFL